MAFSKSVPKGQTPVGCQLCEGGNKIEWKCTDCNLLMCDRCKDKVHLRIAKDHRIVHIREIREDEDSWDSFSFNDIKCQDHSSQSCSLYCKTCNEVICLKCIVKVHNGHSFVDEEEFGDKKEVLKERQKKVEKYIGKLSSTKMKLKAPKETESPELKNLRQHILDQEEVLTKAVEKYAGSLLKEVDQHYRTLKQEEESKIDGEIKNMHVKNDYLGSIITSKDFVKFFRDFDKLNVTFKEDMFQETMSISSLPNFVPGKIKAVNFGTLEGIRRLKEKHSQLELKVTNQWTTELRNVHFIAVCPDETLWIADSTNEVLQHVTLRKHKVKVLSSFNISIFGLVEISSGNILVSTGETQLKLINGKTQKITESAFNIAPFISRDVHFTKDQKVIITARFPGRAFPASGRRIVLVYDQAGNLLLEYENDSKNKPLFTIPLSVTSTSNGNICVLDSLYEDDRGRVVMISEDGNIIAIYTGHHVNTEDSPFKPDGLVATPSDNIVVTDPDNHLVHILNSNGGLISYYYVNDIGIQYPHSVSSTFGKLFIGGGCGVHSPKKINGKLYEVENSEI